MSEVENSALLQSWEEPNRIKENNMKTKRWGRMVVGKELLLLGQLSHLIPGLQDCDAANNLMCFLFSFPTYQLWTFTRKYFLMYLNIVSFNIETQKFEKLLLKK